MAYANRSSLDSAPLLEAEVEEKSTKARRYSLWQPIEVLASKISIRSTMSTLKPSFLDRNSKPAKIHATAWLDGIRGIASFFVFIYHFQHLFHKAYNLGYASNGGKNDHWLIQLPIIRLVFTGGPMVSVFWVLSGISLSLKPIQLARSQSWDKFFDTLFSSVFRRALRLYLPCYFVQTCVLIATCLGMYNHAFALSKDWPFAGTNEVQHEVKATNWEQIRDWLTVMWKFANPFKPIRPRYDVHLWTIQLEFRNSIILFATLIGYAKLRPRIRMTLTATLYAFCIVVDEGDVGLFIVGILLAEFLLIRDENAKHLPSTEKGPAKQSIRTKACWAATLIVGLHLLSWPAWKYETSPGYVTLHNITPAFIRSSEMMWSRVGAAIFLLALCGSDFLRKPFQTRFAVYLGKISFPLYIIHGPINHILGTSLVEFFWSIVGNTTLFSYEVGVMAGFLTEAIVVVWLADIMTRTVDASSVRFGRTLQNRWSY